MTVGDALPSAPQGTIPPQPQGTARSAPYGAWPSPIAARDLVTGVSRPIDLWTGAGRIWFSQSRPDQGGRQEIRRLDPDGTIVDPTPADWNARTRVHEYGGAAWWVHKQVIFSVNWSDQRLYRIEAGTDPVALTPEPASPGSLRYTDGSLTPDGAVCVCVRESHDEDGEVRNEIVAIDTRGAGAASDPVVLVTGPDFVAAPRLSPDGSSLAWIEWQHPDLPWDTTRLWSAELVRDDSGVRLVGTRHRAGRPDESLIQPEWGPDGRLYVVSDRSDWWNVYQVEDDDLVAVLPLAAEVGRPAWLFGQSQYVVDADGVRLTYSDAQGAHLVEVHPDGTVHDQVLPFLALNSLRTGEPAPGAAVGAVVAIATRATGEPLLISIAPADPGSGAGSGAATYTVLTAPAESALPVEAVSVPRRIDFPSADGRTAHALLYLPASASVRADDAEKPPLLVQVHGGPTAAADPAFRLGTQYWTTRGFAVVDVDYGGSTGYGRAYRRLLDGAWGIVDVEDACAAALWLARQGLVDPDRLAIRGGSAGGFTTLAALATRDVFAAGASHFGVADLAALARDTHKFESRYLDGLVGPWPAAADVYQARSPLTRIEGFDRPLIILQGDEDAVVPPAQAASIVAALDGKQIPHAYLLFAGEQHGFRKAENIIRAIEAELSFYAQVFGFEPAGEIEPVQITHRENLRATPG